LLLTPGNEAQEYRYRNANEQSDKCRTFHGNRSYPGLVA
jgi:hypothetical protein